MLCSVIIKQIWKKKPLHGCFNSENRLKRNLDITENFSYEVICTKNNLLATENNSSPLQFRYRQGLLC
jgi:hypothetical protein